MMESYNADKVCVAKEAFRVKTCCILEIVSW